MSAIHGRSESSASDAATLAGTPGASAFSHRQSTISNSPYGNIPAHIPAILDEGRNLVLCFDGTGDQFDNDNSNVVELFAMLKKDDPSQQLVYYQTGIGTYTSPNITTPILTGLSKTADEMIAWNLDSHIISGYEFIMQHYRAKDKISIFGFSRGAYVARSLAGMLHKIGLLPTGNQKQVAFAYTLYSRCDDLGWRQSNLFKRSFCIDVDIHFLGVWDTVSSVGVIASRRLPFTTSNTVVRVFRHAISLDERRAKFQPKTWTKPTKEESTYSVTDQEIELMKRTGDQLRQSASKKKDQDGSLKSLEKKYSGERSAPTDVKEVWFAGAHCDVGGGSVINGVKPCLARIPLRWMIRETFRTNSGIIFDTLGLARIGLDPAALWPTVLPRPPMPPFDPSDPANYLQPIPKIQPSADSAFSVSLERESFAALLAQSEEELDRMDALAPIYDQLALKTSWWLLELWPVRHEHQHSDSKWEVWHKPNWGTGRHIPHLKKKRVKVHRSVQIRMAAQYGDKTKYLPAACNFSLDYVDWED